MLQLDKEKRLNGNPLQGRRTRLDVLGHSVPAPTNRHLDLLSPESFADYVGMLMAQKASGAQDPEKRQIALKTSREKILLECARRITS